MIEPDGRRVPAEAVQAAAAAELVTGDGRHDRKPEEGLS